MSTAFLEQFTTAPVEGPSWLTAAREHAMASFQSSGIPTMRNEDWHFTNPAPIAEGAFGPMRPGAGRVTADALTPWLFGQRHWPRLVFVNGRHVPALSVTEGLESLNFMSLAVALREEPTILDRHITRYADVEDPAQAFSALNTSLVQDGAVVHIPKALYHWRTLASSAAGGGVEAKPWAFEAGRRAVQAHCERVNKRPA